MKKISTLICVAAALFTLTGAELIRPELAIRPAGQKCGSKCSPLCGYIPRIQAAQLSDFNRLPVEKSAVRCFLDDKNLYVEVYAEDKDIVNEAKDNKNPKLYNLGDGVQILLKSDKHPGIWEVTATVNNISNCFFYPGPGAIIPKCAETFSVVNEIKIDGTFNNSKDVDKSWTIRTAIPLSALRRNGLSFNAGENWSILVLRSNYGGNLAYREFSSFPQTLRYVYETARFALLKFPAK